MKTKHEIEAEEWADSLLKPNQSLKMSFPEIAHEAYLAALKGPSVARLVVALERIAKIKYGVDHMELAQKALEEWSR